MIDRMFHNTRPKYCFKINKQISERLSFKLTNIFWALLYVTP